MIDKILLRRYAEAGARRIVSSGYKLEAVSLSASEKQWALNGQSIDRQQLDNVCEIVPAYRRFLGGNNR